MLANHISEIKRISLGIGDQVKEDNKIISNIDTKMSKGQQMMIKTMNKLDDVLNSRTGNVIFYTIVFVLLVFMALYKWTRS